MKPIRRGILALAFSLTFGLSSTQGESEIGKSKTTPNVLLIVSDDLSAEAVSAYAKNTAQTPNIDKLADSGMRFTRAYCQYPACGPSRASFLSGFYPHTTGNFQYTSGREGIGEDRRMLPQLFKDNGYHTARVSKIFHMGVPIDIEEGGDGADDPASWTERFNSQGPEWRARGEGELVQNNPDGTLPRKGGNVMTIVRAEGDDLVHSDGKTAATAIEFIKKHKDEPFFLAVGFVRPHVPFVAPKHYFDAYPHASIPVPDWDLSDWNDIPEAAINYVNTRDAEMTEEQQQKAIAAYYASVSYMDAQVGKVLDALKKEGLEENTIVVFTSDHGFHLGEHGYWMKVSLKEESVRVPLLIRAPGIRPGVSDALVELLDLFPTLADLAGLEHGKDIQGRSLVTLLEDPQSSVRDFAFSTSLGGNAYLLRSDEWAYIQYGKNAENGMELYDMRKDPGQLNNLTLDSEYAGIVEKLKMELERKLKEMSEATANLRT